MSTIKKKEHFKHFRFLIVESDDLPTHNIDQLKETLVSNGVEKIITKQKNVTETIDSIKLLNLTHIIATNINFPEFVFADVNMIPIVTPRWVHDSINLKRLVSLRPYSPNPNLYLKDVFVAVVLELPHGDKEAIIAAVLEHGGQYQDNVTKFTTHVVSMDVLNDACVIANLIPEKDIKCVLPHWIDDCLKQKQKLDEKAYLLDSPSVEFGNDEVKVDQFTTMSFSKSLYAARTNVEAKNAEKEFFKEKEFYLAEDLRLGARIGDLIKSLIRSAGGQVSESIEENNGGNDKNGADGNTAIQKIYVGKYRAGRDYITSSKQKYTVGNLSWLFAMLARNEYFSPLNNLLHYPISKTGLPDFENLIFSATNYTGDGRMYLEKLITSIGGNFSRSLNPRVDYLICARPVGAKYEAAQSWDSIRIRNHLWIEECYKQWLFINSDGKSDKYCTINETNEPSSLLGNVKFDEESIQKFYDASKRQRSISTSNDDSRQSDKESVSTAGKSKKKPKTTKTAKTAAVEAAKAEAEATKTTTTTTATTKTTEYTPILTSGRKAALKAAQKLHSDMEELNVFQKQHRNQKFPKLPSEIEADRAKRELKRKSGSEESNSSNSKSSQSTATDDKEKDTTFITTATATATTMPTATSPSAAATGTNPRKRQKKSISRSATPEAHAQSQSSVDDQSTTNFDFHIITTGCDDVSRSDSHILLSMGIHMARDPLKANIIVAPRIMRTEKFLAALAKGPKYILHPKFITNVIAAYKQNRLQTFQIADYSLEKHGKSSNISELPIPLPTLLEKAASRAKSKNLLFNQMSFNITGYVPGGAAVLNKILSAHGLPTKVKQIKNALALRSGLKSISVSGDKKTCYLITMRPAGDKSAAGNNADNVKLIAKFRLICEDKELAAKVVEWNWVVACIFSMELEGHDEYVIS